MSLLDNNLLFDGKRIKQGKDRIKKRKRGKAMGKRGF
jgi:hypothetical protein